MMSFFLALFACSESPAVVDQPLTPPASIPDTPTVPDVPTPAPAVDCENLPAMSAPVFTDAPPEVLRPFQPRESGERLWGDDNAILTGIDVPSAVIAIDDTDHVNTIRENAHGVFWVENTSSPLQHMLMHQPPGGATEFLADADLWTQFDLHTNGSVVLTREFELVFVGPDETVEIEVPEGVVDVAYDPDYASLWVATRVGLQRWAVDADGAPDGGVPPESVTQRRYLEIEVDACGYVYGTRADTVFGIFGDQVLERIDAAGQIETAPGRREFMGNLRFGRSSADDTTIYVMAGGYSSDSVYMRWDVGVDERPQ